MPERWNFNFDSRQWHIGYQAANHQEAIREYVLPGQTVENWQELVASHYSAIRVAPHAMFEEFKYEISRDCPSLKISIIEESSDNIIFEWQHGGCQGYPPQHEIHRILLTPNGTLAFSYVAKTSELSPEVCDKWISFIKAASIAAPESQQF